MERRKKRRNGNGQIPLGMGLYIHSQAAQMTQTTSRKLTYWAKTKLVYPHIHRRNGGPAIYSYTDLLAIRAVERLRNAGLPLQRMRRAIKYFYEYLGSKSNWWNLKMVVDNKDLLAIIPCEQSPTGKDEAVIASRGGQKPLEIVFADLVNDLLAGGKLEPFPEIKKYISIDQNIQGGAPVISNTRIKTSVIYMWHKRELNIKQIAEMYDGIEPEAINAAIEYEQALVKNNGHKDVIV
jgi:uncharacterized protein (DUF433 family)